MTLSMDSLKKYWSCPCTKCCVCCDVFSNWTRETTYIHGKNM